LISASNIRNQTEESVALRRRRIILLFKDGQLGWVSLLMCLAAVSDYIDGIEKHGLPRWALAVLIAFTGVGIHKRVFCCQRRCGHGGPLDDFQWKTFNEDYPRVFYTIISTVFSAIVFSGVHLVKNKGLNMNTLARRLFPRAHGKEAMMSLSAVAAGVIGSIATLATLVMMIIEHH
jgi:hypothetical protein